MIALLKEKLGEDRVYSIETAICESEGPDVHMFEMVNKFPRNELGKRWKKAVREIAGAISLSRVSTDEFVVILGHAVYHKNWTREFFSVVDSTYLHHQTSFKISHVVLITDDFQDTYSDLTGSNELYGDAALSFFLNESPAAAQLRKGGRGRSGNTTSYIAWINDCINSILTWRMQEIILGQKVADELGVRFMLWGIKQDLGTLLGWLDGNSPIYYVSHPISEPRRLLRDGQWPLIVGIINSLQKSFEGVGLHSVMPTAIDELRFEKEQSGKFTSILLERWPVPSSVETELRKSGVLVGDYNATELLVPMRVRAKGGNVKKYPAKVARIQSFLDGSFTALETTIYNQMANRDLLLVWLTDGIIVIEPWSARGKAIHGGVKKEMLYLAQMNESLAKSYRKRICVVFTAKSIDRAVTSDDFCSKFVRALRSIVRKEYSLREPTADRMISDNGDLNVEESSSLGADIPADQVRKIVDNFDANVDESLINAFLNTTMEMSAKERPLIMPLIIKDLHQLKQPNTIRKAKTFLEGQSDGTIEYKKLATRIRRLRKMKVSDIRAPT